MKKWASLLFLLLLAALNGTAGAQPLPTSALAISVNPGFDGRFRENYWMPLLIRVANDGADVSGRLVVRPGTSGSLVDNTFSAPVDLPSGARKSVQLFVIPRAYGQQVRVELLDAAGTVLAAQNAVVRSVLRQDRLYVVITQATSGSVDLTGVTLGGYDAFQANWSVEQLPDRADALAAVDMLLISDADTSGMTPSQQQALGSWVAAGGHLLVTGGPNWQATHIGVSDLLPFAPTGSDDLDTLTPLSLWAGNPDLTDASASAAAAATLDDALDARTVVARGAVRDGGRVLVTDEGGVPLIVRRSYGLGTVDYLTPDPNTAPLRGWVGMANLWTALAASVTPKPAWGDGFINWGSASAASQIIPGFNLLPDTAALCGFLAAYITLIGPLNYLILNRLNRREWAWVTIPLLIVLFSGLAWATGFNLRGTEVTLNRLSVVQVWHDAPQAHVVELAGLLSPRRATYSLSMQDSSTLRTLPGDLLGGAGSPFGAAPNTDVRADIRQTDKFSAQDVPVDASFIASFVASGMIDRPDISGQSTLTYDGSAPAVLRGAVTNNSSVTLNDAVILAAGTVYRLPAPLAPGQTVPFALTLNGERMASPTLIDRAELGATPYYGGSYYGDGYSIEQTVQDILGLDDFNATIPYNYAYYPNSGAQDFQLLNRRRLLLNALMVDYYGATGRGDRVFLIGWTDGAPLRVDVGGAGWRAQESALYIVELETEVRTNPGSVTITPDRFGWTVRARENTTVNAPFNMNLYGDSSIVFRFTPLPDAVLATVDRVSIRLDAPGFTGMELPVSVWNWDEGRWDERTVDRNGVLVLADPDPFLGALNAVEIRISSTGLVGSVNIANILVEQRGSF